jgi:hypothetical protein
MVSMETRGKADVPARRPPASLEVCSGALTTCLSGLPRSRLPHCRCREQPGQARAELVGVGQLTFPDGDNAPAESLECGRRSAVARNVVGELRRPELEIALWCVSELALRVSVPETAVHNDDRSMP